MRSRLPLLVVVAALCCCERGAGDGTERSSPPPSSGEPAFAAGEPALPGIEAPDPSLQKRLAAALKDRGPAYRARTHHLKSGGAPRFINRLIESDSPYLLQHAHNPVNWYPWGPEALSRARALGRPVFLSVGYSTCHWCHVMERESFEDIEIATYLNTHYVAVKVDREQRPDIDDVYMRAVRALGSGGGWPMTVIMTPDGDPFFGATYLPPRDGARGARRGLLSVLRELSARYAKDPTQLIAMAQQTSQRIEAAAAPAPPAAVPGAEVLQAVVRESERRFDPVHGGFGRAPKFPRPSLPRLLLRYHRRDGSTRARQMVERTLEAMMHGGMHDQVGGGFHRYSTDARFLVPHFEKMLYDNAQLAMLLLEAHQVTGRDDFRAVAARTLDYVRRELSAPGGGFHSASDADSPTPSGHQEEGYFFTWTPAELRAVLGAEDAEVIAAYFDVREGGNFEGRSIPVRYTPVDAVARALAMPTPALSAIVERSLPRLYAARGERTAPQVDDKVLAAWNGLMISAFARGARVLGDDAWLAPARGAASLLLKRMRSADGGLLRSYRGGRGSQPAFLDDYAFVIAGLLDLFEVTAEPAYLEHARALQARLDAGFWAGDAGGYFTGSDAHERLLARERPSYDGALPSGNAVAAMNLLRLGELTGDDAYRTRADALLSGFASAMRRSPGSMPAMLAALERSLDRPREVLLVSPPGSPPGADAALRSELRRAYLPNALRLRVRQGAGADALAAQVPALRGKVAMEGAPTAYVCERGRCELPTTDPATLRAQLAEVTPLPGR